MAKTLANSHLSVTLDTRGNLAALQNVVTGCQYLKQPGLDLWQMIYPHDDDPETPVYASLQGPADIEVYADALVVHHERLVDCRQRPLDVGFSYRVELRGEELVWTAELVNRGAAVIQELWFPLIAGLGSLGEPPEKSFLLYPESAGRRFVDPLRTLADRHAQPVRGARFHSLREFYPGKASMQWLGLYGAGGSLYVGSHDTTLQTTAVSAHLHVAPQARDDTLALGFIKYPFCQPGQTWRSEPFVVAVHQATWHQDSRRYRRFADTYQDHGRARADWVVDAPAMHDIVLLHQYGRVNYRYGQIPEIAAAAATAGIDLIKLSGWSEGGHDNMYPDFQPAERLGGPARLAAELAALRQAGRRSVLYLQFVQMSPNSRFYAEHGEFCALKGPYGNPFIDVFTWPSHGTIIGMNERFQLINACVATTPWQQHLLAAVARALDLGADSVFLDQTAGAPSSFMCFDARHGHASPALAAGPGKTKLAAAARQLLKTRNPQAALAAEYICDVILQYFDFTISFGMGFFPGGQHFGAMYRLTFPEDILFTQYISREDYEQIAFSFLMGYRFFLTPRQQCDLITSLEPAFVARVADLIRLQRRCPAVMRGRYCDTEPLEIAAPGLEARAFAHAGGGAVTLWNPTRQAQPIAVNWPGKRLIAIDTPTARLANQAPLLPPGEVAVMSFAGTTWGSTGPDCLPAM